MKKQSTQLNKLARVAPPVTGLVKWLICLKVPIASAL
jgi:hypothetical protein